MGNSEDQDRSFRARLLKFSSETENFKRDLLGILKGGGQNVSCDFGGGGETYKGFVVCFPLPPLFFSEFAFFQDSDP